MMGFFEEVIVELLKMYLVNCKEIRSIFVEMIMVIFYYYDLEWRFDVELVSRLL